MTDLVDEPPRLQRGRVRRDGWERLSHGLYAVRDRSLTEELRAWSLVLPPTAAFTHLSAAEYRGWWLPAAIPHPVFAAMPRCDQRRRPGLFACRHPEPGPMQVIDGLRITTPAETLLACARDLGLLDLAIMGDSALRSGNCTIADLRLIAGRRRRGAPLLRRVIPLLDPRSESPWETVMRVLHTAADVRVEPQHEVYDRRGRFVARGDLRVIGTNRLQEYDGAVHRLGEVHQTDLQRERRLTRAGWERFGYTSVDILEGGVSIIADLDRLLRRRWDSRRLWAWEELVATSLYGKVGRARAYRQWRRTEP